MCEVCHKVRQTIYKKNRAATNDDHEQQLQAMPRNLSSHKEGKLVDGAAVTQQFSDLKMKVAEEYGGN